MRNTTLILLACLGLVLAACPPASDTTTPDATEEGAVEAGGEEGEHAHAHGEGHEHAHGEGHPSPFHTEGIDASVENLDNGVKMTFTSEDTELVAHIQEHMAKKDEDGKGCDCDCPCKWEGVTRTAENLDNGLDVTLTAEDAELVAKIQEHVAAKAEDGSAGGHGCGHGKGQSDASEHPWALLHSDAVTRTAENLDNGVKVAFTAGCPHLQAELKTVAAAKVEHMAARAEGESDCQCPFHAEGVTVAAEEFETGVALVYTTENAETVTELQEYAAKKVAGRSDASESECGCGKHGDKAEDAAAPAEKADAA